MKFAPSICGPIKNSPFRRLKRKMKMTKLDAAIADGPRKLGLSAEELAWVMPIMSRKVCHAVGNCLIICFAAALATARAQQVQPTSEIVYGAYHIRAIGDTGVQPFATDGVSAKTRREKLDVEFDLTFSRDKIGKPHAQVVAKRFLHETIYTQTFESDPGPVKEIETDVKVYLPGNAKDLDLPGTLTVIWNRPKGSMPYRQLQMSFSEPWADTKIESTVTTRFRNKPEEVQKAYDMRHAERLFLDFDWRQAHWRDEYGGSLAMVDNLYYLEPISKAKWVKVNADWNLSPFSESRP